MNNIITVFVGLQKSRDWTTTIPHVAAFNLRNSSVRQSYPQLTNEGNMAQEVQQSTEEGHPAPSVEMSGVNWGMLNPLIQRPELVVSLRGCAHALGLRVRIREWEREDSPADTSM